MKHAKTASWLLLATLLLLAACTPGDKGPEAKISLAVVRTPGSLPVYVAMEQGIFRRHDLTVELLEEQSPAAAVEQAQTGKADAAVSGNVAATLNILKFDKLLIAASLGTSDTADAVVARPGSGIASPADLKGKRIGVVRESSGEYFLDFLLLLNHLTRKDVAVIYINHQECIPRMLRKEIDAVSCSQPLLGQVVGALQGKGRVLTEHDFFDSIQVLAVSEELAKKRPQTIRRLIEALAEAENRMTADPKGTMELLNRRLGYDDLSGYLFNIQLDQALLVDMANISTWAADAGYTSLRPESLINKVYFPALEAVRPQSVTVIR